MTQITPTKHALLGPSSAHRWLYCTPSARATEHMEEETSIYAEEGTLAHEFAGLFVEKHYSRMKKSEFDARLAELRKHELYSKSMEDYAEDYRDYIQAITVNCDSQSLVYVEQRLDLSAYIPESFGTADCIVIAGNDIHVIDFKYGRGVKVEAEGNDQLRIYGLGALQMYSLYLSFENVHMHIYQPRAGGASGCQLLTEDLIEWGEKVVKPQAVKAFAGEGDFMPSESTCRWCLLKGSCAARRDRVLAMFQDIKDQKQIPVEEITAENKAKILSVADEIKDWLKDVEAASLSDLLEGKKIPGFKLVEGRSNRKIVDDKKAISALRKAGFKPSQLQDKKLKGLGDLEKLVGKDELPEILGELLIKPKGRATIAPESDSRPNYQRVDTDAVFADVGKGAN